MDADIVIDTPRFGRCADCPVAGGACWARRKNLPRLCAMPRYRDLMAEWGAEGGPDTAPHPKAPPAQVMAPPKPVAGPRLPTDAYPLYLRFGRKARFRPALGVLCAAEATAFPGLKLMLGSLLLSHDVPVTVFDLGMTPEQLRWLRRQPVDVVAPDLPEGCRFETASNRWTLWVKPILLDQTPYDVSVWLDSDLVIDRDLGGLLPLLERDRVAIFPDTFDVLPHILLNKPELYDAHPVPEVWPSLNSGVVAFAKGHPFIGKALDILRWVMADPGTRKHWISCWDQGCIKHALESLGIRPIEDRTWNRAGWTVGEMAANAPMDLGGLLARCKPGEIAHFQGMPKPWADWGEMPLSLRPAPNLSVTILGHEPFARPAREWITPLNLSEADPDQAWGECRYFDSCPVPETEYVGLASFSWRKKYAILGALMPWELGELDLRPDVVHCALPTGPNPFLPYERWEDHMEHFNPGILPVIAELRRISGRAEVGPSAWSNNWVVHRDVFAGLVAFYREVAPKLKAAFPVCPYKAAVPAKEWGYGGEAIAIHYLATRGDLTFVPMRWGARVPRRKAERSADTPTIPLAENRRLLALVNACPSRGCRTGCQKTRCERDGKDVYLSDCRECVKAAELAVLAP